MNRRNNEMKNDYLIHQFYKFTNAVELARILISMLMIIHAVMTSHNTF